MYTVYPPKKKKKAICHGMEREEEDGGAQRRRVRIPRGERVQGEGKMKEGRKFGGNEVRMRMQAAQQGGSD